MKTILKIYLILAFVVPIALAELNIITTDQGEGYLILFLVIPSGFILGYITQPNNNK